MISILAIPMAHYFPLGPSQPSYGLHGLTSERLTPHVKYPPTCYPLSQHLVYLLQGVNHYLLNLFVYWSECYPFPHLNICAMGSGNWPVSFAIISPAPSTGQCSINTEWMDE